MIEPRQPLPAQRPPGSPRLLYVGSAVFVGVVVAGLISSGVIDEDSIALLVVLAISALMACAMLGCAYIAVQRRRWVPLILGLAIAFPAGGLTDLALRHGHELRQHFLAHAVHTEGVVVDRRSTLGRRHDTHYVKYRFPVPGGFVVAEDEVNSQVYHAATNGTMEPILYDPDDIKRSEIETKANPRTDWIMYTAMNLVVIFMSFMLPFIVAWSVMAPKSAMGEAPPEPARLA